MSNLSNGGAHVSFEDGNHGPPEEISASNPLSDITMQSGMKNIFSACDTENSNSVFVSDLINYILPHMQEHISEVLLLKKTLDPNDSNPRLDSETFFKAMTEWTAQIMKQPVEIASNVCSSTPRKFQGTDGKSSLSVPSSSRDGGERQFGKDYAESGILNVSNTSSYSCTNNGTDTAPLQERVNELDHQNRKLIEELQHCRSQLAVSEEQNEALQADVLRLTRRLHSEQHVSGQLERDRHNVEELLEASTAAHKQIGKLEKDLASADKQICKLKGHICDLETENQKIEDKIDQMQKREFDLKKVMQDMQTDMDAKEQEIAILEETNVQMKSKLDEQQQVINHYTDTNKCLKEEKIKLEKLCQTIKTRSSSSQFQSASKSFSEYSKPNQSGTFRHPSLSSPIKQPIKSSCENQTTSISTPFVFKQQQFESSLAKFRRNRGVFNSPRLLSMLANPVSPDNSIITSSGACKKSIDSDSPVFSCKDEDSVFVDTVSTPDRSKCSTKTVLDCTPPSVVRRLPVLKPTHEMLEYQPKPHKKKRDTSFFSQYRFVGSSSSDEEEAQISKTESVAKAVSQIQQEYDPYFNIITHTDGQQAVQSLPSNGGHETDDTLPTMYVVDRTSVNPRCKSASSGSPVNRVLDSSNEDDSVYWKLVNLSPHDSLEVEITQAKRVENENAELKNTIEHLIKENNQLRSQFSTKDDKAAGKSPERLQCTYEVECKALKIKVQELESDNNHKYIKIIDLMEEKERLQKELNRVSGKDTEEINKLKQNISELHHEKGRLQQEIEQAKWEKQNFEAIIKHLQSVKSECDHLQKLLQQSKQNGDELHKQFDKISAENYELKTKIEKLKNSLCETNGENNELNARLKKLTEEYLKLKNINIKTAEEMTSRVTRDEMNAQLHKLKKENEELKHKQESMVVLEDKYKEVRKSLQIQQEEIESFKETTAEHKATIERLKLQMIDFSAVNSKLSQSITEKDNQIAALKQIVAHQNESLKTLTDDKDTSTTKLYEKKYENEKLAENVKELGETNKELMNKLQLGEQEKKYLRVQLDSLEETNRSMVADLALLSGDYKNIKDSQNNLLKEYQSLLAEKELLVKTNQELVNDFNEVKDLKEVIEQKLVIIKNEKDELAKQNEDLTKAMEESQHSLHSAQAEVAELNKTSICKDSHHYDRYTKDFAIIQEKISELENTNTVLQLENEKLQEDFEMIRGSYESLVSEKELWFAEKSEWLQLKEELSKKLTRAMDESKCLEERLKTMEAFKLGESSCSNCVLLKTKIENLNECLNELRGKVASLELQDQTSSKNQGCSYDKMQMKIEKLKNKYLGAEELLKTEKEKNAALETENLRLQAEVQKNLHFHEEEKKSISAEVVTLEKKLVKASEDLMKVKNELYEMEQEKQFLLKDCDSLKEKLDVITKDKENRLKCAGKEITQLKQEIHELVKQKGGLEKKVETSQNLLKCKLNVDKVNKDNLLLKQQIGELNDQKIIYDKKLERMELQLKDKQSSEQKLQGHLEAIARENLNLKQQIENLDKQKTDLNKRLEKSQRDLQKAENRNLSIRKELTDMQSACEDTDSVDNLIKEKDSLQKLLKDYENELTEIKLKLSDSSNCLGLLSEHVKVVNEKLVEKRKQLHRCTLIAVENWCSTLGKTSDRSLLEILGQGEPAISPQKPSGPLDEEMIKFKHQIDVTSSVLETFVTLGIYNVRPTPSRDVEVQATCAVLLPPSTTQKCVTHCGTCVSRCTKKFYFKAESPRCASPDSPSIDIELSDTSIGSVKRKSVSVRRDSSSGFSFDPSSSPRQSVSVGEVPSELSEEVQTGIYSRKPLFEIASPSLSDNTLENLGLLHEDESPKWSKKEIEEKFTLLVGCFMMDVASIKDRSKQQEIQHSKIESKFSGETEKLTATLTNIKKLGKDHQIDKLVSNCLRQVRTLVCVFSQAYMSAMQYGALQHEERFLKVVTVMINHAANLKQVVENATHRLKSISSPLRSPEHKKMGDLSNSSSNESVQFKEVSSFYSNEDVKDDSNSSNEVAQMEIAPAILPTPDLRSSTSEYRTSKEQHSKTAAGIIQNIILAYSILFISVIVVALSGGLEYLCSGLSVRGYPWRWVSWDDIFAPFVKRTYPRGPPPT